MAEAPTTTTKSKGIQRLQIGLNVLVQLVLIFFLISAVNWYGFRHYKRWDVSRDQKYALSDKTKRFLNTLKGKVRVTNFFPPDTPISGDVASLLMEYQYAATGQLDLCDEDVHREREHQISGTESLQRGANSCRHQNRDDRGPAIRLVRSRAEIAPRFLGQTRPHSVACRSFRENSEAGGVSERA